jgi:UDP-N-acetyl-D-mannosaminuronic acid dehydrogenase
MPGPTVRRLCVLGLGYIGLPTAALFAARKIEVIGVDLAPATVETVNRGQVHIAEPDLDIVVQAAVQAGYLRATQVPEPADAFLIAVPTPICGTPPAPDLTQVAAASRAIAPLLQPGNLVILESTVPVGTTEALARWLAEARPDLSFPQDAGEGADIRIAHCPERVLPGRILHELVTNDRVIGGMTARCAAQAERLYRRFVTGACIHASGPRAAEMAKLAENSFRDVNIAFANELSLICDGLGMDVWDVIALANRHPRVSILRPGPGVGGHCIAVDPWFLIASAPETAGLLRMARAVNDARPDWVLAKVRAQMAAHLADHPGLAARQVTVACYGLAFKADVDDLRESPALRIAMQIAAEHPGPLLVAEPHLDRLPETLRTARLVCPAEALRADIHVMLVDHRAFRAIAAPRGRIVDTRGIWR